MTCAAPWPVSESLHVSPCYPPEQRGFPQARVQLRRIRRVLCWFSAVFFSAFALRDPSPSEEHGLAILQTVPLFGFRLCISAASWGNLCGGVPPGVSSREAPEAHVASRWRYGALAGWSHGVSLAVDDPAWVCH